ncbi:MAG: ABC transporter permease [Paracoccus sp. (in: a-proteobacteria)]|uniref:ABC transporter permease n=1 Tax=Paracoccus sp. TaxID=267 RepID=UPI0039E567BD
MDATLPRRIATLKNAVLKRTDLLFLPAVLFMLLLFAFPLLRMAAISTGGAEFSLESYRRFFEIPSYVEVLVRTLVASLSVTGICLVLGYPVAMMLANAHGRMKSVLLACVILPYLTSLLVRTYAWMVILGETGPLNNMLMSMGLIDRPLEILFTTTAAMIGMVHLMLPAMVLPLYSVVQGIDRAQLRAAQALGGGPARSFFRVFLPQTLPGLAAGSTLVFALSLGFYITPQALGSPSDLMLSNLITSVLNSSLDFRFASAIALILLACTGLVYVAARLLFRRRAPRPISRGPRPVPAWRDALARRPLVPHRLARGRGHAAGPHPRQYSRNAGHRLSGSTQHSGGADVLFGRKLPELPAPHLVAALVSRVLRRSALASGDLA